MKAFVYLGRRCPSSRLVAIGTGVTAQAAERDAGITSPAMGRKEVLPNGYALDVAQCCASRVHRWAKLSPGKADGDFTLHAAGCPKAMP